MKAFAKVLLVGVVAVMAIAVSVAPSEAAKKKKAMKKGMAPGAFVGQLCASDCGANATCKVNIFLADGKWYQAGLTPVCVTPYCPPACM